MKEFIITCTTWLIDKLNELSKDYRTVARQIDKEQIKQKLAERVGHEPLLALYHCPPWLLCACNRLTYRFLVADLLFMFMYSLSKLW